jgi:RND superfamily putative drug exporter
MTQAARVDEEPQSAPPALGLTDTIFTGIGGLSVRFRYVVVVLWLLVTALAVHFLPSLSSVSNNNNSSFLPKHAPSLQAAALAAPFERGLQPTAQLVAVSSAGPLTRAGESAITKEEARIQRVPGVLAVRDQGTSGDGQARKALVEFGLKGFDAGQMKSLVDGVRATFRAQGNVTYHLTGQVATQVDNQHSTDSTLRHTQLYSVIFILALLLVIFRSLLAPLITLLPAGLVLILAGPVIAEATKIGVQVSDITQIMLSVLLLGAGTDYGLFLIFRVREELRRGLTPRDAVIKSLMRVGETITFSAATVVVALLCLLFAVFGFYQGLGPALAIGVGIMLLSGLTLLPALLAIFGRAAFWPTNVRPGAFRPGAWGLVAGRIVRYPLPTLIVGVLVFGSLALFTLHYKPSGFTDNGSTSTTSDSARGTAALEAHFPAAQANPTNVLLRYPFSVWQHPSVLSRAQNGLRAQRVFAAISGPLAPNGTPIRPATLARLHRELGPAVALPPVPPAGAKVPAALYNAYHATAQFISPDGKTLQYYTTLRAGDPTSTQAMQATPSIRHAVTQVQRATGATASGVAGQAAASYDISSASSTDLDHIVPIVLIAIAILLGIVLRSLIAPIYLIVSVGISYLAALGLSVLVFMVVGHGPGLNFILPFLMFLFLMALGEDYNILVMTRIREESHEAHLGEAVTRALAATGNTVTSAGMILAGTFGVLAIAGSGQIQQIGFSIAVGILMDTFLVRTLLIPSTVVLLGRWNWWPSRLMERHA